MFQAQNTPTITWDIATEFEGNPAKLGFAGMAAGVISSGFLICGGANFPEGLPWEGGKKTYSDRIYFWDGSDTPPAEISIKLPKPSGYFGYVATIDEMIIVGGESADGPENKVFNINKSKILELPSLPLAVTAPALILRNNILYLMGGDAKAWTSDKMFYLNLNRIKDGWKTLAPLPHSTANASVFLIENSIYLLGGRSKNQSGISTLHSDILRYDIASNRWENIGNIEVAGKTSPFTAPAFFSIDNRYLVLAGGDDGKTFHQIETYLSKIKEAKTDEEKANLIKEKDYLVQHHLGFNNSVLIYDTHTNQWLQSGKMPYPAQVTTASAEHGNELYIFSGEVRPGVRSPRIIRGKIHY